MKYKISFPEIHRHLLLVEIFVPSGREKLHLQLPSWRPGRYEETRYASNIFRVNVRNAEGKTFPVKKVSRNVWELSTGKAPVSVSYNVYAAQMDAGGSWVEKDLIYLNFINFLLYVSGCEKENVELEIDFPTRFYIAGSLSFLGKNATAETIYQLYDSPLIAAPDLLCQTYQVGSSTFYIWFSGEINPDWDQIRQDFIQFTQVQVGMMGDFPVQAYHFLIHILPYRHYHGVEHASSTVITLGPDSDFGKKRFYKNLLGISSHELFHAWNICRIRPKEMLPYDFSGENYFDTGYVAEGFTTYYGDLFLIRSGVFTVDDYFEEINQLLKRHFENFGRRNFSLAESSFDLWVDGYSSGTPDRKVSIYVKGALVALMLDLTIRKFSEGAKSLDDLMRILWQSFGKKSLGYVSTDIQKIAEALTGKPFSMFFSRYVYGTDDELFELRDLLDSVGCELSLVPNPSLLESIFGVRISKKDENFIADLIDPESDAAKFLAVGDEVLEVNGMSPERVLKEYPDNLLLKVKNLKGEREIQIPASKKEFLPQYRIKKLLLPSEEQTQQFKSWLNRDF